ncbi:PAS domain S-box protein [Xanthobacter sp. DSM 24535]|uniref:PAS domain S-box protein n=1 Tax=Roseixanthobacter psychrophilus TaxID=3119917 RepID=UPI003727BA01
MPHLATEAGSIEESWSGWRPFTIESRTRESDIITSFVFRPVDGNGVPRHRPGQHLTLLIEPSDGAPMKRNYTISGEANGETYRVSVKREPQGQASKWLHDAAETGTQVKLMPPSGSFLLPADQMRPVVLLSGGVGLTPMVCMLEALAAQPEGVPAHFVHVTQDGAAHAFGPHVKALADRRPGLRVTTFYSRPRESDVAGRDFDRAGQLEIDWLADNTPLQDADYFICGPLSFMRTFVTGLAELGVPHDRIHFEFFGPVEELIEAPSATPAPVAHPTTETKASGMTTLAPFSSGTLTPDRIAQALVASNADAIVASDREGTIILWNPGAERIFGFSEQEALGQSLDIIIPEPFRARHWEGYHQTVASGESRYGAGDLLAVPGLHKDGRRFSIEFTIVLLKNADGKVEGMVSSVRDVNARFEETKKLRKELAELKKPAA